MAISYSKYVNVKSSFADAGAEAVDLTGLVILPSTAEMKNDAPAKEDFDAYKMVTLNATNYAKNFAEPTKTYGTWTTTTTVGGNNPTIAWDNTAGKWKATCTGAAEAYGSSNYSSTSETFSMTTTGQTPTTTTVTFTRTSTPSDSSSGFYDFATKYFAYVSPSGGVAMTVKVMKMRPASSGVAEETPVKAFERAIEEGDSFGSVYFPKATGASPLELVAKANALKNNDYRFVVRVSHENTTDADYYTNYGSTPSGGVFDTWAYDGLTLTECPYLSMAILAATDYDGTNTATTHEFKTLDGEVPTVTDDTTKEKLDRYRISYYGQTKANGTTKSFYQEGFNADGTDTACYDNEMWMKRTIVGELLSLEMSVEKIPPTPTGVAMVVNAVTDVANRGLKNGSILPEKPISQSQKASVIQMCGGDKDAPFKLNQYGYILAADIVTYSEDSKQKYKIVYKLVYLKGDAVRYVEGTHNII